MRLGIWQLIIIFLLAFLLFGNFTKIKEICSGSIIQIKEMVNQFLNK